jgi:hypothetical protein
MVPRSDALYPAAVMLSPAALSRTTSRGMLSATALILLVLAARLIYLRWLSPWELVADEAHYWEWSRRLDWSYYTKGPGVAWVIWLSTKIAGTSEFAVRAPSAIAAALMALIGAKFAADATDARDRAPFYVALCLVLTPALVSLGQLMTTDVFCATGWMAVTWLLFRAVRPGVAPRATAAYLCAAGFMLGLTCLFKYTVLLLIPGLLLFLFVERRRIAFNRSLLIGTISGTVLFAIAMSPIVIWNITRGWPTIAHQIGRLRLPGGDESVQWNWSPLWFLEFAGAQIALLGVIGAVLLVWAFLRERRWRRENALDDTRAMAGSLLICSSVPLLVFYVVLSVFRQAQGNWAVAGYSTLMTFVGIVAADAMRDHRERVTAWRALPAPRPRAGRFSRRPETGFQIAWHWFLGIGVLGAIALAAGPALASLPGLRNIEGLRRAAIRASGAKANGLAVADLVRHHTDATSRPPLLIADRYQEASLIAFYMSDHPRVYSAASHMGARPNAYDFFEDTDLSDPAIVGRDAFLFGASRDEWSHGFLFATIEPVPNRRNTFLVTDFRGPRLASPHTR